MLWLVLIAVVDVWLAFALTVVRFRAVRRLWEAIGDMGRRVRRLEDCEQLLLQVTVRTYGENPEASPFEIRPLEERVVLSAPVAVLADLFWYQGESEVSLLRPSPYLPGPMSADGDHFLDVILTRASHG